MVENYFNIFLHRMKSINLFIFSPSQLNMEIEIMQRGGDEQSLS